MADSPVFRLTDKDGAVYDITAPDEATAVDAFSKMKGGGALPQGPPVSATDDIVKSAGTGLTRGLANIPGLPGDLISLAQSGAQAGLEGLEKWVGYKRTPEQEAAKQEALKLAQRGRPPTSQDIRDTASSLTGVGLYEPQTDLGKFAETAGEFTSGALAGPARRIPDLIKQAVKFGTVPGLVSEGAGQLSQTVMPGNQTAETVARIAGGLTPAGLAAAHASRTGIRPPAPGVDPNQRLRQAQEFGVPLTEGQATGNINQQAFEEASRHAAKGDAATRTMQEFDLRQKAALDAAVRGQMQERLAGGFAPVEGADVAGDIVSAAVKRKVAGHEAEASRLYQSSEANGTVVDSGAAVSAPQSVAQKLAAENFPFDEGLHPSAFKALAEVERLGNIGAGSSTGIGLREVDTVRKRIGQLGGQNAADARAVGLVKKAFDGWLDDTIDAKLFSGDPAGLSELKAARVQSSAGKRITDPKPGDDAGKTIAKMAEDGRTGQEVGNWLYGSSVVGAQPTTVRIAQRMKGMFGQQSEEWSAIRQGAWTRIVQGATASEKGAQAVSSAIHEFLEGKGKALSQVLYSPEEREHMRRFGQTAKYLVPNPRATNPSRSSYGIARMAASTALRGVGAALGFTHGGLMEMGLGALGGGALDKGSQAWRSASNAAAANRSVNPKLNAPIFDLARVAPLVARAGLAGAQPDRPTLQNEMSMR